MEIGETNVTSCVLELQLEFTIQDRFLTTGQSTWNSTSESMTTFWILWKRSFTGIPCRGHKPRYYLMRNTKGKWGKTCEIILHMIGQSSNLEISGPTNLLYSWHFNTLPTHFQRQRMKSANMHCLIISVKWGFDNKFHSGLPKRMVELIFDIKCILVSGFISFAGY